MSANIYWEPVPHKRKSLPVGAPQHFMSVLGQLGWHVGGNLNADHLPGLRACAMASPDPAFKESVRLLVEAIENHGEVRVWAEY